MRKITQAKFDALPVIDGIRQCPGNADYSAVVRFGAECSFGAGCRFGAGCSFGEGCKLENTKPLIGNTVYSFGGFGSENRTTYMIPMKSGIYVRCGCWAGTLSGFRKRIVDVYSDSSIAREYAAICDVAEIRWKREKAALDAGKVKP